MVGNLKLSMSSQCIKYLMFIFNLLFVITGIILLSIGSVIHGIYYNYEHFLDNRFFSVPSLLIAIGSIIFFIAFFGCCGALRENYCMIITFASFMVLIFILELSAGISGYVLRNDAENVIKTKMESSMNSYINNPEISAMWDAIQTEFTCCGAEGPEDWVKYMKNDTVIEYKYLPMSCCPRINGTIGIQNCSIFTDTYYKSGCLPVMVDFIKGHALQLGGAGIGIAFVQALGIWFSVYLARAIKKNYHNMA